ncbi:MAG: hypothetical protein HY363_04875 [Candidatus Aenigmarchaeota archaeon]|nr:hypothetical protein [Candidatus Aenigmarchaeota archaeon]
MKAGCEITGFEASCNVRVVSIKKEGAAKAYGEGATIDSALWIANKDYLRRGGRTKRSWICEEPCIFGSPDASNLLDKWIHNSGQFRVYRTGEQIFAELKGFGGTEVPEDVVERIKITGKPVSWKDYRGFVYKAIPYTYAGREEISFHAIISNHFNNRNFSDQQKVI